MPVVARQMRRRATPARAQHSGQLLNLSQLGGQLGLDTKTVGKYTAVFEQLLLLQRLVKTPKLHFNDAGLLAAMTGLSVSALVADRARFGPLL